MISRKVTIALLTFYLLCIADVLIASSNPLRATGINSYTTPSENYSEVYSSVNNLILAGTPVLIKDDIDKYLDKVSRKVTVNVIDNATKKTLKQKKNKHKKSHSNNDNTEIPSISFDFPNVTLVEFTRFIANLNKKILIGENLLQGNITIKTPKKLTLKRLMNVFSAILNSRGLSYLIAGKYLQIYQKSDSEVKVYQINYLTASDVAKSLSDTFKMSFDVGGQPEKIMINSLDDANCVVVLAPKARQLEIEKAIKKLDWRRRQVLLEIMIVELTYTKDFGFGVTAGGDVGGSIVGGVGPSMTSYKGSTIAPNLSSHNSNPYTGLLFNDGNFMVDLQANEYISTIKILNQPRILTAENQKAEINVGHQEPIIQAQTNMGVSSGDVPASETSVDWKDIGTDIKITPRINSKRDVTLDFDMTITSIVAHTDVGSFKDYPVIGQRITKNTSTIKDNHTLIIGGLLKDEKKNQKYKVPFLGDAPYIGWMFSTFDDESTQTELVMFITPRVIESTEDGQQVTYSGIKKMEDYDSKETNIIKESVKGKRGANWNTFNLYDYFNDDKYRQEQDFIPQNWQGTQ